MPLPTSGPPVEQLSTGGEAASLEHFITTATEYGLRCDRSSLVHLYVTLKAHNSILIAGPAKTGKIALVYALGQALTEDPTRNCQTMVGHARWASGSHDITKFVELQSRFNDNQILSLMVEAGRAENRRRLYLACLIRITPFEIYRYLSSPGFQFWPWMIHRQGSEHEESPIPFPLNFRLISTMDTGYFQWWDRDLLTNTAIVLWNGDTIESANSPAKSIIPHLSSTFLDTCIYQTSAAYRQLKHLLRGINEPFGSLLKVTDMMSAHGIQLPPLAVNQAIRYLANAWSKEGKGLFYATAETNLRISLDMALTQYVLPWAAATGQPTPELQQNLAQLLDGRFPRAMSFTRKRM